MTLKVNLKLASLQPNFLSKPYHATYSQWEDSQIQMEA